MTPAIARVADAPWRGDQGVQVDDRRRPVCRTAGG